MSAISKKTRNAIKPLLRDYLNLVHKKGNTKDFYFLRAEKKASAKLSKNGLTIYDFGIAESFTIFSLYAKDNNLDIEKDYQTIIISLANMFNIPIEYEKNNHRYPELPEICRDEKEKPIKKIISKELTRDILDFANLDNINYFDKWHNDLLNDKEAMQYIKNRGISERFIDKYYIGFCKETFYFIRKNGKPIKSKKIYNSLVFRINDYNFITRTINLKAKTKSIKVFREDAPNKDKIFNSDLLFNSNTDTKIFITEGIFNGLTLEELNPDYKVVIINSIYSKNQFLDVIKEAQYKGTIYIIKDVEESGSGEKGAKEIAEELTKLKIKNKIYNYDLLNEEKTIKKIDINDLLITRREELKRDIEKLIN